MIISTTIVHLLKLTKAKGGNTNERQYFAQVKRENYLAREE
jgi:hypothetical protein